MFDGNKICWLQLEELFGLWKIPHVQPSFFIEHGYDPAEWRRQKLGPFRALTPIQIFQIAADKADAVRNESNENLANIEVVRRAGVPIYRMPEYGAVNYEINPYHGSVNCVSQTLNKILFRVCVQWRLSLDSIRLLTRFFYENLTYCEDFITQFVGWFWRENAKNYRTYKPKKQLEHNMITLKGFGRVKKQFWDVIYDILPFIDASFVTSEWGHVQVAAYALITVGFEELWYFLNKARYSGKIVNGKYVLDGTDTNSIKDLAHSEFDVEKVKAAMKDNAVFKQINIETLTPAEQMSRLELVADKVL